MKKLVFMFVALAAVSFASCGSKTEAGAATDSVDSTTVDSLDSTKVDSVDSTVVDSAKVAADSVKA